MLTPFNRVVVFGEEFHSKDQKVVEIQTVVLPQRFLICLVNLAHDKINVIDDWWWGRRFLRASGTITFGLYVPKESGRRKAFRFSFRDER